MLHLSIAFCILICVTIYAILNVLPKLRRWRHLREKASSFPGPSTLPIIGNAHLFAGSTEAGYNKILQLGKLYPSPYRLWLGHYLTFIVNTPEQLKVVLQSPKTMNKGVLYDFVRPWLGTGLLSAPAAIWKVHRKLVQPAFNSTILKSYVDVFAARSSMMALKMGHNLDGPEFDVYDYTSECTLHTICETTMGVDLGAEANSNGNYAKASGNVLASVSRRAISPWLHPNSIFYRTQIGKEQAEHIKFLHTFTDDVIHTKQKELLEQKSRTDSAENNGEYEELLNSGDWIPQRKVFLDHLMEISGADSEVYSDEALRHEVHTIMVAGSDTTAMTSSFVMLMLASHPEVQEKVFRELCEIYEDDISKQANVTPAELTRMTYMERVIKETMRLFPISPILPRSVEEDLEIGEHTLPAGSVVVISIGDLHRNDVIWPDPLKFDPDRFLPEEVQKRDSFAYLPFGGGPRNCIGAKYAMMSMKTLLATVLRRYILKKDTIIPVKDLRVKWEFVLRPVDPITLRIERRTTNIAGVRNNFQSSMWRYRSV